MAKETVSQEKIEHTAKIARIHLTSEQLEALTKDANAILEYFSLIEDIPDDVKPCIYVLPHENEPRKDVLVPTEGKAMRRGFAKEQEGYMQAPKSL